MSFLFLTVTSENVCRNIRNVKLNEFLFSNMRFIVMFVKQNYFSIAGASWAPAEYSKCIVLPQEHHEPIYQILLLPIENFNT